MNNFALIPSTSSRTTEVFAATAGISMWTGTTMSDFQQGCPSLPPCAPRRCAFPSQVVAYQAGHAAFATDLMSSVCGPFQGRPPTGSL